MELIIPFPFSFAFLFMFGEYFLFNAEKIIVN